MNEYPLLERLPNNGPNNGPNSGPNDVPKDMRDGSASADSEHFDARSDTAGGSRTRLETLQDPRALPVYRLYRKLRRLVLSLEHQASTEAVVREFLAILAEDAAEPDSAVIGGRAYRRLGDAFELFDKCGESGPVPLGYRVSVDYPVIRDLLERGWVLVHPTDPRFDAAIEAKVGGRTFAAIIVGPSREYLLSFSLREPVPENEVTFALISLVTVADMALRQQELVHFIEQANEIQTSLLPKEAPEFPGYEIAFRCNPAVIVGGDVYDFLGVAPDALGVAIGDATGHGLPAALQARDLVVGLRMGTEENLKLVKTMEKLDRVLRSSGTPSRFISVFYTEIDHRGNLIYVNAGHVPPVILRHDSGRLRHLASTGPVMGLPFGQPRFEQSFQRMWPGDVLLMTTDGITEAKNEAGDEFGHDGLARILESHRGASAQEIVDDLFQELETFTHGALQSDDRTAVAVRRLAP